MIFAGPVTAQNVRAWRTLGDYQPGPDEPHPHELATAAYTTAVGAAAAAAAGYAADKMASLHGRRGMPSGNAAHVPLDHSPWIIPGGCSGGR